MRPFKFPIIRDEDDDIIAVGVPLQRETLAQAYIHGIFPWPIPGYPLPWFCPRKRAILEWDRLHIPRTLLRVQRKTNLTLTVNQAFERVMIECGSVPRPGQDPAQQSWITPQMILAYTAIHKQPLHQVTAMSVEAWNPEGDLVGGIYGVLTPKYLSAESMFFHQPYASKLSLLRLIEELKTLGHHWMDIQMLTPHMRVMGARNISRKRFLSLISTTEQRDNS